MGIKNKIEKVLFFIDDLDARHHKTALLLKICLWICATWEMVGLTLTKRAYRKYIK